MCSQHERHAHPGHEFEGLTARRVVRLERANSQRRLGEATAQSATAASRGRGTSFSTAAVMTPSVPSEPTKSWRRQ